MGRVAKFAATSSLIAFVGGSRAASVTPDAGTITHHPPSDPPSEIPSLGSPLIGPITFNKGHGGADGAETPIESSKPAPSQRNNRDCSALLNPVDYAFVYYRYLFVLYVLQTSDSRITLRNEGNEVLLFLHQNNGILP